MCLTNGYNRTRSNEFRQVLKESGSQGIILNYPDTIGGVRNNWSICRAGVEKDLQRCIKYKNWDQIVTYNPEGVTGHMHHLLTYDLTKSVCDTLEVTDKLWYYQKFYTKGHVPEGLPRISDEALTAKRRLTDIYVAERSPIEKFWAQMLPYENWVNAPDWGKEGSR